MQRHNLPPKNIEINTHFQKALHLMEGTGKNIFVTGRAGTGKSTLLDYFRSITKKQIVVLAPTGVAAVNVSGQTIHSFFRFKPDVTVEGVREKAKKKKRNKLYKKLDAIVIDEISMVRADLLDCVDEFLRINGKVAGVPFGGIQMILIGDLYQIPPVVVGQEREIFKNHYKSEYFFDANAVENIELEYVELEKIYRQSDALFITLLNGIRNKTISDEEIELINNRCFNDESELPGNFIYLTTTNAMADERNDAELAKLPGKPHTFPAEIMGKFDQKYFPTEQLLKLKKDTQVMLLNNDPAGRWINGTIGSVHKIKDESVSVRIADGNIEEIKPFTWEINRFFWNTETLTVNSEAIGTFKQYPIKIAWAITIHKSQGKTFDNAVIDIGRGTFTSGQLYVALSRCRSLDGIFLKKWIKRSNIWTDWRIVKFTTEYQYELSEKQLPVDAKIELIDKAISSNSLLGITYLKPKNEKSRRIIRPENVGEMEYKGRKYLGVWAYCLKQQDYRSFRVDRILKVEEVSSQELPSQATSIVE